MLFGDVSGDAASARNIHVWGANADNWNLPDGVKIRGGGQANDMGPQKPGVFGIVTTPVCGAPCLASDVCATPVLRTPRAPHASASNKPVSLGNDKKRHKKITSFFKPAGVPEKKQTSSEEGGEKEMDLTDSQECWDGLDSSTPVPAMKNGRLDMAAAMAIDVTDIFDSVSRAATARFDSDSDDVDGLVSCSEDDVDPPSKFFETEAAH